MTERWEPIHFRLAAIGDRVLVPSPEGTIEGTVEKIDARYDLVTLGDIYGLEVGLHRVVDPTRDVRWQRRVEEKPPASIIGKGRGHGRTAEMERLQAEQGGTIVRPRAKGVSRATFLKWVYGGWPPVD